MGLYFMFYSVFYVTEVLFLRKFMAKTGGTGGPWKQKKKASNWLR